MYVKVLKILAFLGALFLGLIFWDSVQFGIQCHQFHQHAQLQQQQISFPPQEELTFVVLTGDKDRIPKALALLQNFPNSSLLISGLSKKTSLAQLAEFSSKQQREDSNLWKRVVVESEATSTAENAQETEKFLKNKNIHKLILITSDYHMTRSLAVFDKWVSVEVVPYSISSDWPARALLEYWKWVAFRFNIF